MELIFKNINSLAVFAFIFSTLAVTQLSKWLLAKRPSLCLLLEEGFFRILLSWLIGAVLYFIFHLTLHDFPVTEYSVMQYAIWILLANGGYKVLASLWELIKKIRGKV